MGQAVLFGVTYLLFGVSCAAYAGGLKPGHALEQAITGGIGAALIGWGIAALIPFGLPDGWRIRGSIGWTAFVGWAVISTYCAPLFLAAMGIVLVSGPVVAYRALRGHSDPERVRELEAEIRRLDRQIEAMSSKDAAS